jgi:hypothetical protein
LLAAEGTANISVFDLQRGLSNPQTFNITENAPALHASVKQGRSLQNVRVSGQVIYQAF